jgi:hypothetical protein
MHLPERYHKGGYIRGGVKKLWLAIFNCSIIPSVTEGDLLEALQMLKQVCIETSVTSFYYEIRKEPKMVAHRNWTRERWNEHCDST